MRMAQRTRKYSHATCHSLCIHDFFLGYCVPGGCRVELVVLKGRQDIMKCLLLENGELGKFGKHFLKSCVQRRNIYLLIIKVEGVIRLIYFQEKKSNNSSKAYLAHDDCYWILHRCKMESGFQKHYGS